MDRYLLGLRLRGRRVVVVGGAHPVRTRSSYSCFRNRRRYAATQRRIDSTLEHAERAAAKAGTGPPVVVVGDVVEVTSEITEFIRQVTA